MAYVYRHIRLDTKKPFYVGKGNGTRAWSTARNNIWKQISLNSGYRIEFVKKNLNEDEALKLEAALIKLYRSFGCCEANMGTGVGPKGHALGVVPSEETRRKMGDAVRSRPPRRGYTLSEFAKIKISQSTRGKKRSSETRERISIAKRGAGHHLARPVICVETGKTYVCGKFAAEDMGLDQGHISAVCRGERKTHGGYTFKFLETAGVAI
jgi:hypothetical protein